MSRARKMSKANIALHQVLGKPEATTEDLSLTEEDRNLLHQLDSEASAPLLQFLRKEAPEFFVDCPKKLSAEAAEDLMDRLITGDFGSNSRKRGLSRWGQVRTVTTGIGGFADGVAATGGGAGGAGGLLRDRRQSFIAGLEGSESFGGEGSMMGNALGHQEETEEEKAERAYHDQMQHLVDGLKSVSERHRDRTTKLRLANRDIADVAVQVVASPGVKVVSATGRPPPSHAVDAVGGIKQQMKTTHGEPPLMVLRQELDDRQALAAAMPRIRARVAEFMGKLQKQQASRPRSRPASAMSGGGATSSLHRRRGGAGTPNSSSHSPSASAAAAANNNMSSATVGSAPGVAGASPYHHHNHERGSRADRDINEIARRLHLRSETLRDAAEHEHRDQVEKRKAASLLRRELVQQGMWVEVKILSMFRPPITVKAFVASWNEFKSMVVQAVSPMPPGCTFASLAFLSGAGAKSVIDPRHPLLRPLRGFEVVRGCKTRDGTCATLTVSVAVRSSGGGGSAGGDSFIV